MVRGDTATVHSVEEIRAARPREVGIARILLIAAVIVWLPLEGHLFAPSASGLVALAMLLVVAGSFGAARGRQAGRVVATVALAVLYLAFLPYCWLGFSDPYPDGPYYAVLDLACVLASAVALVLLYHPRAGRYVRLVGEARQHRS